MAFRKKTSEGASKLEGISLFAGLTSAELARVAELVDEVDAEAGAVLTEQGKPGDDCFVVMEGEAAVLIGGNRVATTTAGGLIGEMSLLDNRPRSATVRALTPMKLLVLDTKQFRTLLDEMPTASRKVMAVLSERLRAQEG